MSSVILFGQRSSQAAIDSFFRCSDASAPDELRIGLPIREPERRALSAQTLVGGGATIPQGFVPAWEGSADTWSVLRRLSTVERIEQGNPISRTLVDDSGVEAVRLGDGQTVTATDPTFSRVEYNLQRFWTGFLPAPIEWTEDAEQGAAQLAAVLARASVRGQQRYFVNVRLAQGAYLGVTAASTSAINSDEIENLIASVGGDYLEGSCFLMNVATFSALRKLKDSAGSLLYQNHGIAGFPVFVCRHMPGIGPGNMSILFGNFPLGFKIMERPQVRIVRSVERLAELGQVLYAASTRADGHVVDPGSRPIAKLIHPTA